MLVLCFVVLITGLVLALLSRSASSGLISNASVNFTRTDIYGRGAIDQVIGDLRQEVAAGSTVASVNGSLASPAPVATNANGYVTDIYRPSSPATAVPAEAGPSTYTASVWNTTFPNLLKESIYNVPFYPASSSYTPAPSPATGRAAPVSTSNTGVDPAATSGVSRNGRFISLALWNEILLLPKSSSNSSVTDTTPDPHFVAPDWILTAADGTNPTSAVLDTSTSVTTSNVNPQSPKFVVGRYAYAIYNEGGLLDANVAGSPAGYGGTGSTYPPATLSSSASSNGGPSEQTIWSHKGPSSFADLTVLPGIANVTRITPEEVSDDIIGWRNNATAQAGSSTSSTSPSYNLAGNSAGINSYFSYLMGLTSSFMTAGNLSGTTSDHIFTSRKQLISFLQALVATNDITDQGHLQDAMMYLGTFSRSLNQPSYWPDPARPRVTAGPSKTVNTQGGNDASGLDDKFNPPFKSIRVAQSFTRNDGTAAVVGEPLVKKRFPLSRLCWITYKGPSATLSTSDPVYTAYIADGVSPQLLSEGTAQAIGQYFGLAWTAGSANGGQGGYWTYNTSTYAHAKSTSSGLRLSLLNEIAGDNRDPDFFELLQAAICCGSLGGSNANTSAGSTSPIACQWQMIKDQQVGLHALQIGANIIDEASPDSFPTHIVFNNGTYTYSFWGNTDLPYVSDIGNAAVISVAANPVAPGQATDTLVTAGIGVAFAVPSVWNPYAPTSTSLSALAPTALRVSISDASLALPTTPASANSVNFFSTGENPQMTSSTTTFTTNQIPWIYGTYDAATGAIDSPTSGGNNNILYFNNSATLYREPTPLLRGTGTPTLTIDSFNAFDTAGLGGNSTWSHGVIETSPTNTRFLGFLYGQYPIRKSENSPAQAYSIISVQPSNQGNGMTVSLEYQAGVGGPWIPYQQYLYTLSFAKPLVPYTSGGNTAPTESILTGWPEQSLQWGVNATFDPRSSRYCDVKDNPWEPFLDSAQTMTTTYRPTAGPGVTGFGSSANNTGASSQNIVATGTGTYFADPDGVVRRAMGGYNSNTSGSSSTALMGLPMAPTTPLVVTGVTYNSPTTTSNRPIILHRPFRSVAELGYVFSDRPWKNLDFFSPESGDGALLDTFCINEDYRPDALTAGRVDLNTKQVPVLAALLAGAYRDEISTSPLGPLASPIAENPSSSSSEAQTVAQALVTRTTSTASGKGPLFNIADLVGRLIPGQSTAAPVNGATAYDGFPIDLGNAYTGGASSANSVIQRFREASMRALSDAGQAGTWNLLIDVVAQSGRYPVNAAGLNDFLVDGERHYWVHVAIDRSTGQVIDEKVEVVNE